MHDKKYCNTECCNSIKREVEYILLTIDLGKHINLDAMAGTLVQVLLMVDIPAPVGLAVCAVALILAQMKMEPLKANNGTGATSSTSADAVTTKLKAHVKAMQEEAGCSISGSQDAREYDRGSNGLPNANGDHGRKNPGGTVCSSTGNKRVNG